MNLIKLEFFNQEKTTRKREQILKELVASYEKEPDITLIDVQHHLSIVQKEIKSLIRRSKRKKNL